MDNIPVLIAIPLAIVLWAMWLWVALKVRSRIADYFANRRHIRRMRNYMTYDANLTRKIFANDSRHRR